MILPDSLNLVIKYLWWELQVESYLFKYFIDTKLIQLTLFWGPADSSPYTWCYTTEGFSDKAKETLQGFIPVIVDWHCRIGMLLTWRCK